MPEKLGYLDGVKYEIISLAFASIAYKKWRAFNSLKQMVYVGGKLKWQKICIRFKT